MKSAVIFVILTVLATPSFAASSLDGVESSYQDTLLTDTCPKSWVKGVNQVLDGFLDK